MTRPSSGSLLVLSLILSIGLTQNLQAQQPRKSSLATLAFAYSQKGGAKLCVRLANTWHAAKSLSSTGRSSLPALRFRAALNRKCRKAGKDFSAGAVTYANSTQAQPTTNSDSGTLTRIGASGETYDMRFAIGGGSTSVFFDLPNRYSILELANPPLSLDGTDCYYALLAPSGSRSCLEGVRSISTAPLSTFSGRAFKADAGNSVYFIGGNSASNSNSSLYKISSSGVLTHIAQADELGTFSGFELSEDGGVVLVHTLANTSDINDPAYDRAPGLRYVDSSGTSRQVSLDTRALSGTGLGWLFRFSNGRIYCGLSNLLSNGAAGTATNAQIWQIKADYSGLDSYLVPAVEPICSGSSSAALCTLGATQIRAAASTSSASFVVAQDPTALAGPTLATSLVRLYPSLGQLTLSSLSSVTGIAAVGDTLILAGLNASNQGVLVSYALSSGAESVLLSGIRIGDGPYYSRRTNAIVAYGNDFSSGTSPSLIALQIPVSSDGTLGALTRSELPLAADISMSY